ncbi:hypothetical protein ACFWTE_06615 [Nocardiopsis sp. NPDC058631]
MAAPSPRPGILHPLYATDVPLGFGPSGGVFGEYSPCCATGGIRRTRP